jgi:hypothetical protein
MWDNGDRTDDGSIDYHDAPIVAMDVPWLNPGERTSIEIDPIYPEGWLHVRPGSHLRAVEGRREVGAAVVRELVAG